MLPDSIVHIISKFLDGEILASAERQQLDEWRGRSIHNEEVFRQLQDNEVLKTEILKREQYALNKDERYQELLQRVEQSEKTEWKVIPSYRRPWFRYAAAAILILGIGAYLWNTQQKEKPNGTTASTEALAKVDDVAPGGDKAVLTLADGTKIILDSAANGKIAEQAAAEIKKEGGQIIYSVIPGERGHRSVIPSEARNLVFNTLSTPRGGQYQLTLPDGTKVWLNAASSITYPTAFTNNTREVTITGEAYFEVAKDKSKPFIVATKKLQVRVLGTHFNVNAYEDESSEKVTLAEGSVNVAPLSAGAGTAKEDLRETKLKPGEQAVLVSTADSRLSVNSSPDLDQVLAWKNGVFNFNKVTLEEAMRQLSRWYDVEVVYEGGKIPAMRFGGKIGRDLKLSQVLNGLQAIGVQFEIEERRLTVKS